MNDQEIIASARRAAAELGRRPGDLDRFAAGLLKELADRLDAPALAPASYLDEAAAEVRAMLGVNTARHKELLMGGSDEDALRPVRAERLQIIGRLTGIAAVEAVAAREAGCGRCPPRDGDITEGSNG